MYARATFAAIATAVCLAALPGCSVTRGQSTVGEYIDDATITTKVKAQFVESKAVDAAAIKVETLDGTVMLSGFAKSSTEKVFSRIHRPWREGREVGQERTGRAPVTSRRQPGALFVTMPESSIPTPDASSIVPAAQRPDASPTGCGRRLGRQRSLLGGAVIAVGVCEWMGWPFLAGPGGTVRCPSSSTDR